MACWWCKCHDANPSALRVMRFEEQLGAIRAVLGMPEATETIRELSEGRDADKVKIHQLEQELKRVTALDPPV